MAFDQKGLDDYVDVAQRIADFRDQYPEGSLRPWNPAEPWRLVQAEGWEGPKDGGKAVMQSFIVVVAAAYRHGLDDNPGVGMAWEIFPGRTPYTRGSELQNAETSAWGRAIIAVGASDSKRGIASREEVRNRQAEREGIQCPFCKDTYVDMDAHMLADLKGCGSKYRALPLSDRELMFLPRNQDGSLSRSRTSDEQKAAAGVMTDAEQRAHNQLAKPPANAQPVDRLAATPDSDPWYDNPAPLADLANPEDRHGTATADQIRSLQAKFTTVGVKDRNEKIAWLAERFGVGIHSSKDLSYTQAAQALQELSQ